MIKIAIQDSYIKDEHVEKLVDACEYLNIPFECFGLIPDTDKITGDILNDKESTIIPFGATKLIHLYNQEKLPRNWKIFHDNESFSHSAMLKKSFLLRLLLLNADSDIYNFPQCEKDFFLDDLFVKPANDLKLFNGQILPSGSTLEELFSEQAVRDDIYTKNEKVLFAPLKQVVDEYRVFVVKDEVVAKSLYKIDGKLTGGFSYKFTWLERFMLNNLAIIYKPDEAYVVDICTTQGRFGKNWHILEYNAIQCSGFYNCDVRQILHALTLVF
jgi:hypothetical protein